MDHNRFDDLTRALATTTSRRQFLKVFAGSATGGLLALLGIGEAAADDLCKPIGKKCRKSSQCCAVANATVTCTNLTCGFICNTGFQLCNDQCVATCTSPKELNPTTCTCECPSSTTVCGNTCCSSGQTCQNSTCCSPNEGTCSSNTQCCSHLCDINAQICVSCLPEGHSKCIHETQCCAGLVCDRDAQTCVSCIPEGHTECRSGSDCCSHLLCDTVAQTCVSCIPEGHSKCTNDPDCCAGLVCNDRGTCVSPP